MQQDADINPFAGASNLGRKRDADESGIDSSAQTMMAMSTPALPAASAYARMPLPKRRTTDLNNVPTLSSLNSAAADPQAYHAFDAMPHSPQHSLNLYAHNGQARSPGVHTDAMNAHGYYTGTIAVGNPENGQVDPGSKHILRHIQVPSYNPSNPSSSLTSPSAHSVFTSTTDADAPFYFEHDSPDMMRDEDTSAEGSNGNGTANANGHHVSHEEAMMLQQQQQLYVQQQQQEQLYLQQLQQQQQQQQQPQAQHMNAHPLSNLAGTGMFTTQNPIQAAYDSYNGGFLDEFDDSMAMRYTGQNGDQYAARLEGVMGHA